MQLLLVGNVLGCDADTEQVLRPVAVAGAYFIRPDYVLVPLRDLDKLLCTKGWFLLGCLVCKAFLLVDLVLDESAFICLHGLIST